MPTGLIVYIVLNGSSDYIIMPLYLAPYVAINEAFPDNTTAIILAVFATVGLILWVWYWLYRD